MSQFDVQIEKLDTVWNIKVIGVIDEDANFDKFSLVGAPALKLFLKEVVTINSCGIREWISWMNKAGAATVEYFQCPKVIVDQINMVQGFLPASGTVQSFFVPYFSEESSAEKMILFTAGKEYSAAGVTPPEIKDESGNVMEMDVLEAKYFKFLKK